MFSNGLATVSTPTAVPGVGLAAVGSKVTALSSPPPDAGTVKTTVALSAPRDFHHTPHPTFMVSAPEVEARSLMKCQLVCVSAAEPVAQ